MDWPLLEGIPEEDVRRLLETARARRFARGEVVFHRGDPADNLHLVVSGRFAVRVTTPRGHSAILSVLGAGDIFGELALLAGAQRSATVTALEPARTWAVYEADFARLRREHPSVTEVVVAILAGQVRRLSEQLIEALFVSADVRVRRRVADLAAVYGDGDGPSTIPLTQEDLADLAGTSRATVNRVLREEARRDALELARGRVIVRDADSLRGRRPQ